MSIEEKDFDFEKFISYDEETNISQCVVPECHTIFIGKRKLAIKRHYSIVHDVSIDDDDNNVEENDNSVKMLNIHNSYNNEGECNPHYNYSIRYLNDNSKADKYKNDPPDSSEEKRYRTFLVADYVNYCKQTNTSKCLIRSCERPMSGRRTGNIKRHYHKVHNFVIVHDNQETISAMNRELKEYYNNDSFGDNRFEDEMEDEASDVSENYSNANINFEQFIDYDPLINKSLCKVPGCKTNLVGRKPFSIKRHYGLVHNFDIESNGSKVFNKTKYSKISNGQLQNSSLISVDDLVVFDTKSSSFQCLFINCKQILEKHLPTLKRHYHEIHKIIIARDSDNIPQRFYRKRKSHDMQLPHESEFCSEEDNYIDVPVENCFIKNELISDDETPHCSKRPKNNLTELKKEIEPREIKPEKLSKDDALFKSQNIDLAMTKQAFFKLCLDLVTERDLPTELFDDCKYFKKLLTPFEQEFDCQVNSTVIERRILKANDVITRSLKDKFSNKILCLELIVINQDKIYLIVNVRFLDEHNICNKVIGFLPITEDTKILPLSEFLSKFNIDTEQVYMTTLLADEQDDEEIYKICDNIYKHNPDIKHHPIYDICTKLRSFLKKYSEDIKCWYAVSNFENNSADQLNTLKEFASYMENITETDIDLKPELKEAKYFLKSLQIIRNFIEKLSGEHYVAGDFYRDLLCCELELKSELTKNNNSYAGKLYEELANYKNSLLENSQFLAALYLDARFNFLGSRLLSDEQKIKGKLCLCSIWEKFNNYLQSADNNTDPLLLSSDLNNDDPNDDEYALLNEHINETMPLKSSVCIEDKLTNCVPAKREPFSLDILKYWHCNRQNIKDINELTKIAFTFSSSQYMLTYLQRNFTAPNKDTKKFDKFLIKNNQNILEKNIDLIFEDLK